MFVSLLANSAACWYSNLKEDQKKTWTDLKKLFENVCFNSNSWVNSQRIENRKLKSGESCANYINDLIELAQLTGREDSKDKDISRGDDNTINNNPISFNRCNKHNTDRCKITPNNTFLKYNMNSNSIQQSNSNNWYHVQQQWMQNTRR